MTEIKAWKSNNGNIHLNKNECAAEDGLVHCKICKGSGLEKYEHHIQRDWLDPKIEIRERTCTRCKGLGFVEINPEDDEEYQKFLELKQKYERDSK